VSLHPEGIKPQRLSLPRQYGHIDGMSCREHQNAISHDRFLTPAWLLSSGGEEQARG
jgi:hypothetical protein